jgi:hypothetical protein
MKKILTLAGMCILLTGTSAMAQNARTVIANAERALGNVNSIT